MSLGRIRGVALGALLAFGCGGSTEITEVASGNTNWLKQCVTDDECGGLSCACGTCRYECDGAIDCSLQPEQACLGASNVTPQAEATVLFEVADPDAYASEMAVDADGSIVLLGGAHRTTNDLAPWYPTFWLAKLDAAGELLWRHTEPSEDPLNSNAGRTLALGPDGELIALSTIYDGSDTSDIRRFDADGALLDRWSASPGFALLASAPGGELFAAGSRLLEMREGRPYSSAWVGRIAGQDTVWEQSRTGLEGGVSMVDVIATDATGQLVVGGSLGTEKVNNASVPWLARLDANGEFLWEETLAVSGRSHCDTTAVAITPDGTSLASAHCVGPWVRAYDDSGRVLWERRFGKTVTGLAGMRDGGYVVGLGYSDYATGAKGVELLRYDSGHRLLWRTDQPGCYLFEGIVATEQGVLALAGCATGYQLTAYADP